jgi:hypothetical protein
MEDNNSEVSDAERSQLNDLFKEMKSQIKDKDISKYLVLIEHQAKELSELKKENTLLKNQLTYILKRILLNKNDYTSAARTNRLNSLNSSINYNRSMAIRDSNGKSNSMMKPLKSLEYYRSVTENISSRYKEGNDGLANIGTDGSNNNVDNRAGGYLNSLYRHNFNNRNKAGGNFFMNKNQTLTEELFPNKENSFYMNTENEQLAYDNNNNKTRKKRENNSSERRGLYKKANTYMRNNYETKSKSTSKRYKPKFLDINNDITKKRNKENIYLDNKDKGKYNTINSGRRAPKKRPIIYAKTSPYLANKF